jgi:hypothetical protein
MNISKRCRKRQKVKFYIKLKRIVLLAKIIKSYCFSHFVQKFI